MAIRLKPVLFDEVYEVFDKDLGRITNKTFKIQADKETKRVQFVNMGRKLSNKDETYPVSDCVYDLLVWLSSV